MKLTFNGGAKMVTGANYLLESSQGRILIDCGLFQGSNKEEGMNFEQFPYDTASIDAVLITHSHIDHVGRLPKLYKEGFRGVIYSTAPTKDIAENLLVDSEGLLQKEAQDRGKEPLYDVNDIAAMLNIWKTVPYHQSFSVKDFEIIFYNSGHILGSAFVVIKCEGKKIVFSGDLGNIPAPLVKDTEYIAEADYAVVESAYGNKIHEKERARKDFLEDVIEDTVKKGGVVMIPAFAMERTQELLYELNELVENKRIPPVPVFVDSPLAIKLTGVYKKYSKNSEYLDEEAIALMKKGDAIFDFPRLTLTLTTEQSKSINSVPPPKIILAGSGMSHGGRIIHHEYRYLPDPNSTLLFIGYQVSGFLGRNILDGEREVMIFGEKVPVRCRIVSISGYSAHADQELLMRWIIPMRASLKKVFVVQGEREQMEPFAAKIRDELAVDAVMPEKGESFVL